VRVGSTFYVATNAKRYFTVPAVTEKDIGARMTPPPVMAVKRVLDFYKPPSGGYIQFGSNMTIYGVHEITVSPKIPPELNVHLDNDTMEKLMSAGTMTAITLAVEEDNIHVWRQFRSTKVTRSTWSHSYIATGIGGAFGLLGILLIACIVVLLCKRKSGEPSNGGGINIVNAGGLPA